VVFQRNYIRFGCKRIPLFRVDGMPVVQPEIISGLSSRQADSCAKVAAANSISSEGSASWEYCHRILAHASHEYCVRTAEKAQGLLEVLGRSQRPCPECLLGKMKAPRRGHGVLSTGLPAAKPGDQFSAVL
jgi:hypothetical protein